jgi:hypothetical protein
MFVACVLKDLLLEIRRAVLSYFKTSRIKCLPTVDR